MSQVIGRDLIHRFEKNPIIELEDLSFTCLNIMNAGAVKIEDHYILLVRIETMKGHSVFVVARSTNGTSFTLDKEPIMVPSTEGEFQKYEEHGVADPRITYLDGVFYIMYVAFSRNGRRLALAKTTDFKTIQRLGLISDREPDNHNGHYFLSSERKYVGHIRFQDESTNDPNETLLYFTDYFNTCRAVYPGGNVLFPPVNTEG